MLPDPPERPLIVRDRPDSLVFSAKTVATNCRRVAVGSHAALTDGQTMRDAVGSFGPWDDYEDRLLSHGK